MKRINIATTALLLSFCLLTQVKAEGDEAWKKEMERKIDILTQELEKSKLGDVATPPTYEKKYGFAPAASKVYHINHGVSIGGYGEMLFQDYQGTRDDGVASGRTREIDFLRAILYTGYKFSDKILFNSEIEYEHATTSGGDGARGEVSVEFAYLDFHLSQPLGIRTGMLLVPVGIINELHEPTLFHGSKRPNVETNVLPTTWRENGVGLYGTLGAFSYRSYLVAGLQAVRDTATSPNNRAVTGFSGSSGLRGGRSKGARSAAEDMAWVSRIDFEGIPGSVIGGSLYSGKAGQNMTSSGEEIDAPVDLWELHAISEYKGLELKGLYTKVKLGDVSLLNAANSLTGSNSIGQEMFGGYAEIAFDVLSLIQSKQYLAPFVRYERYDTQQGVPTGFSESGANDRTEWTYGLTYKPHPNTVIKGDVQNLNNKAGTGIDQVNAAIGYLF